MEEESLAKEALDCAITEIESTAQTREVPQEEETLKRRCDLIIELIFNLTELELYASPNLMSSDMKDRVLAVLDRLYKQNSNEHSKLQIRDLQISFYNKNGLAEKSNELFESCLKDLIKQKWSDNILIKAQSDYFSLEQRKRMLEAFEELNSKNSHSSYASSIASIALGILGFRYTSARKIV